MSIAGKESQTCGGPQGHAIVNTPVASEDGDKKASKVSKLREMFQTGSVRPVEDWAEYDENELRLLRTCPGSPPLLALRERRPLNSTNAAKLNVANGVVPPARPPKPKDLWLKSGLTPRHVLPTVKSRISPRLWKMFTVFEGGSVTTAHARPAPASSVLPKTDAMAPRRPELDSSKCTPVTGATATTTTTITQPPIAPSVTQPREITPDSTVDVETAAKTAAVFSTVSTGLSPRPIEHDSSTDLSALVGDEDLQQAEPVAVATADEDDEEEDEEESVENEMQRLGLTTVPQLEPPPGLKIVAVDPLGVHILEDGNFFYASPSIFSKSESSPNPPSSNPLEASQADRSQSDAGAPLGTALSLSASDTGDDGPAKRVRFSDGPIMVFSTHSTVEYDRKNDEIDPIASSAAYELEKRLETMELLEIDLKKVGQGLGLNIVGVGLDLDGGENLGIFIKAVVPGGAADLSKKVKPNDQIVEVDGINLVGVSYEFAAQTLRNTGDTVHFILGRATDPANLWMLTDPEENGDETTDSANSSTRKSRQSSTSQPVHLDDSFETLHKMLLHEEGEDAHWLNDHEKTDSVDLSSDNEFPFVQDANQSDDCKTPATGDSIPVLNGQSGVASPRSALKGTATAASTKRRHDAVARLIELAAEKSNGVVGTTSETMCSVSPRLVTDGVLWTLASDLLDSKNQLTKLQSQVQTLEQQLTAQEAAADEAIERLRMQCIQLEWELHDAKDLHMQITRRNSASSGQTTNGTPFHVPRTCPVYRRNRSYASEVDHRLPPLGSVAPVGSGKSEDRSDSPLSSDGLASAHSDQCEPLHGSGVVDLNATTDPTVAQRCEVDSGVTADVPIAQDTSCLQRSRLTLVSSGGLANRRPRTRLEINPPPFDLNWPSGPECNRPTYSSPETPLHLHGEASPSGTSATDQQPAPSSEPEASNATGVPNRRPAPHMGVQLPGLTDGIASSVVLRSRRGDWDPHSEAPSQPCISSPVIVQQSLDQ